MPSDQIKIASWNVNSIKVRGEQVIAWLKASETDILMMQETKSTDENFPTSMFEAAGYKTHAHGQKTYNGVAIVSRIEVDDVRPRLPHPKGNGADEQARYLEVDVAGITLAGLYLPNGNPVFDENSGGDRGGSSGGGGGKGGGDGGGNGGRNGGGGAFSAKFTYKLDWMRRLAERTARLNEAGKPVLLGGDFNIIPDSIDAWDIAPWRGDALHRPESLAAFRAICWQGYTDLFRAMHPQAIGYSFWDYQGGAWQKDHGIRIDHLLTNAEATDRIMAVGIDKSPRGNDRASDHTPIWCVIRRP